MIPFPEKKYSVIYADPPWNYAADWSVYSPGTILYIEGIGERTVQDRGGAISGQKIDVFFNNHEDALHFGRQEVRIKVISDTER